jgi:uncharacterized protein (UPF0262 family)
MSQKLVDIRLDEASLPAASADADHDRRVAVFDLLEQNVFAVDGHEGGPYALDISIVEQRLVFKVADAAGFEVRTLILSLSTFRKTIRDYFAICDSYYDAIRTAAPDRIEAIDMARRGLHNEGSELLVERLAGKVRIDHDTARRLFTLICTLHSRT